jgi:anti-sigma factor RsiW
MSLHEEFADDLALYALGSLDGAERQTLEKHLKGCASCRRELELLRGDGSLLALTTAGPKPPARARQRLMSAIAEESRYRHAFRWQEPHRFRNDRDFPGGLFRD